MNSAPITGAIDAQTFRNIAKAMSPTVVYIRTEMKARQDCRDFFGGGGGDDDLFRRFFGGPNGPDTGRTGRSRRSGAGRGAESPPAADCARIRHRLHHQQGRLHPDQQPRRRGRDEDSGVAVWRRRAVLCREADRPRPADRQRADRAHREAHGADAGSQVRRFIADGARRLGHGHRESVRLHLHGHRRRDQRHAARIAGHRRTIERDAADRRGDQPGQLRRAAAERRGAR